MRLLAWCMSTSERSAAATPLRASTSCATSTMRVVAILKTCAAVHDRDVVAARDLLGVDVGPVLEAGARHVELVVVGAVACAAIVVDDAALAVLRRLHHHRRPRVAEEHGQVAEARVPGALLRRGRRRPTRP